MKIVIDGANNPKKLQNYYFKNSKLKQTLILLLFKNINKFRYKSFIWMVRINSNQFKIDHDTNNYLTKRLDGPEI